MTTFGGPSTLGGPEVTKADKLYDPKKMLKRNTISFNYNQGILLVEGSYAMIKANILDKNIKANIALGGKDSGNTRISWNRIENSKAEGIFVVEGEDKLLIEDNDVKGNIDGIVMVNSKGVVRNNKIKEN